MHRTYGVWPASRAMLRSHVRVRCWCSMTPKLSSEEMERQIQEMNAEMNELFGGPPGEPEPRMLNSVDAAPTAAFSHLVDHAPASRSPEMREARGASSIKELDSAKSVLISRIAICTEQLDVTTVEDIERATRLATCIGECARAVASLEKL